MSTIRTTEDLVTLSDAQADWLHELLVGSEVTPTYVARQGGRPTMRCLIAKGLVQHLPTGPYVLTPWGQRVAKRRVGGDACA